MPMSISLREPFPLFAGGTLLYVAALAVCLAMNPGDILAPAEMLIPLFGLPFLLLGGRAGWRIALYVLLLLPAFHWAAVSITLHSIDWRHSGDWLPGVLGGVTGGLLSFLALAAFRLAGPRPLAMMATGILVLAMIGGFGIRYMDFLSETRWSAYGLLLSLYLPWQLAFAFFLARLLRVPNRTAPG
jgi:hypothetical protein